MKNNPAIPTRMLDIYKSFSSYVSKANDKKSVDIILILSMLVLQAIISDEWMYPKIGWLDPWYYVGYGLNYTDPTFLNDYYKISRLPWIWLEFAARSIFQPVAASWILQLSTLFLASISLYFLFLRTLGRNAAFLGACFFVAYTFTHASGGADYHNALSGPLFALAWFLTVRAAQQGGRGLFVLGIVIALTVHSNILFSAFLPILLAHYYYIHRQGGGISGRRPIYSFFVLTLSGFAVATLVLGTVNHAIGRDFFFFMQQFKLAVSFADSATLQTWWHPWGKEWLLSFGVESHKYLSTLLAALLFAIFSCVCIWKRSRVAKETSINIHAQFFLYAYIYAGLLWIGMQSFGKPTLEWSYFAYLLAFPSMAAILAGISYWGNLNENLAWPLGKKLFLMTLLLLPFYFLNHLFWLIDSVVYPQLLLTAVCMSLVPLLYLMVAKPKGKGIVLFVALFAVSQAYVAISSFFYSDCHYARNAFQAIYSTHLYLRSKASHGQIRVWGNPNESVSQGSVCEDRQIPLGDFYASLSSTGFKYFKAPWDADTAMQTLVPGDAKRIMPLGGLMVYVTQNEANVNALTRMFTEEVGPVTSVELYKANSGPLTVPMYLLTVVPKQDLPATAVSKNDLSSAVVTKHNSRSTEENRDSVYTEVPLASIVAAGGTKVAIDNRGRVGFVTPKCNWCYAAQVDLLRAGMSTDTSKKQFVVVRARVIDGRVGLALYERGNLSSLKGEVEIAAGDFRDLVIPIENVAGVGGLVIRSVASGTGAKMEIESIKLSVKK